MSGEALTDAERRCLDLLAEAWNVFAGEVCGKGDTAHADAGEFAHHIHILQNMIAAQAAARAYPNLYRLIGESFKPNTPTPTLGSIRCFRGGCQQPVGHDGPCDPQVPHVNIVVAEDNGLVAFNGDSTVEVVPRQCESMTPDGPEIRCLLDHGHSGRHEWLGISWEQS